LWDSCAGHRTQRFNSRQFLITVLDRLATAPLYKFIADQRASSCSGRRIAAQEGR
jgi:hypothetical protein